VKHIGARGDKTPPRPKFTPDERTWMLVLPTTPRGKAVDRFILRWTGFSLMSFQFAKARRYPYRRQQLLLTTVGSKTGALRTSALPYFYYQDMLVVCGSKGGGPRDPFWSNNLRRNPQCWIRVKRRQLPAVGQVAEGEQRDAVFDVVATQNLGSAATRSWPHSTVATFPSSSSRPRPRSPKGPEPRLLVPDQGCRYAWPPLARIT